LEDSGVDGRLIFDGSTGFRVEWDSDCIELAQAIMNQLNPPPVPMARANAVMNIRVP